MIAEKIKKCEQWIVEKIVGVGILKNEKNKCFLCEFFYVTWDKRFPYGCKAMGFKGSRLPCVEVRQASGAECLSFREK